MNDYAGHTFIRLSDDVEDLFLPSSLKTDSTLAKSRSQSMTNRCEFRLLDCSKMMRRVAI
ncbi:hypothetical protein DPMN_157132 [Dreissena polymorpha]|uniref:Uncharacterized protein n=1 Tax=Dreissena polymorpha TaxID=45954 RepID=A0A9D4INI3_DREPO|nr:hypothetical protein DPMN_157132 [Dreissena polymorpha]